METPDKQKTWRPSWKFVVIAVLLGVNIILIRIIGALVYRRGDGGRSLSEDESFVNRTQREDTELTKCSIRSDEEKYRNELYKDLCQNKTDSPSGCLLCPPHWLLYGDDCYYYSDVSDRTWDQSRDHCKMMGADLVTIKDKEQQEFILSTLRQGKEIAYWIGLHCDGDDWRWADGEPYNSSLFQLKTHSSGHCVSMNKYGYYQVSCKFTSRWICVKKALKI
ncbi:C-type lectin domain family 7 member A-like [Leptodactylus fuscus]|uniref:C-type lectin domain family 7 member A-like n=1 Tax=Leptodactylus fuscus TaxID=238119 RepID=UPI003F4F3719